MADLLLHSLAEFTCVILPVLDAINAKATIEIGVEYGLLSPQLIARAENIGGFHVGIDPSAKTGAETCFPSESATLIAEPSLDCLPLLKPADAYLVDGDHNYYTVLSELRLIRDTAANAGRNLPLTILHDVGWPCARRDQYYNPERIPAEFLLPHSYDLGCRPNSPMLTKGGFRGNGAFAAALREGGPRNGVLTAIEDFMAETPGLSLSIIPLIFGVGILSTADTAKQIETLIAPYRDNPLLAKLERNRIDLFLRVLDHQDKLIH